jgi:nucleoside-diphosphate-sugar epimerase
MTLQMLEDELSRTRQGDCELMRSIEGDIMILGAAGKMGPSLARLARRAADESGCARRRIIAVSRSAAEAIEGVETISCDLLDRDQLADLPDCANVLFLAGRKFGSTDNQPLTWATNALLPALVAERFRGSRIVALSSGNVYPLVTTAATEQTTPGPVGEYAQSVLARERMFEYFSARYGTPVAIIRLNYAIDLRYGVLLDIGERVWQRRPVSIAMGAVNLIWQGDANSACLRALALASSPPLILNVTGPETLQVRSIAERFGEIFGIQPMFEGREAPNALLNDSSLCCRVLGPPRMSVERMIGMTAEWIRAGGPTLRKPTHFEVRDGAF